MNNKKRNRKGFTIVELSIVIAVIAILAAVMIPTFANIVGKAKNNAALNNAKSIYTNYVNACVNPDNPTNYEPECWVEVDGKYVKIENGAAVGEPEDEPTDEKPVLCSEHELIKAEQPDNDKTTDKDESKFYTCGCENK